LVFKNYPIFLLEIIKEPNKCVWWTLLKISFEKIEDTDISNLDI